MATTSTGMTHLSSSDTVAPAAQHFGAMLSVAASLVWLLQAWGIAWGLAALLNGVIFSAWGLALGLLALGTARSLLNKAAHAALGAEAEARIQNLRAQIVSCETTTADPSHFGGAGSVAALITEKLDLLRPYLLRYKPARMRVMVLPLIILALTAWFSWAAAVVLLAAGPLIPVFMALVGWAAKEASSRQMAEIGSLNDLLADRLAALSDLKLIGAGAPVIEGFADASEQLRHRTMAVLRIAFLSSTVLEFFSALGVAMIAVWVGFSLLGDITWGGWGTPLTPAAGIYILLLAPDFFAPLRDLAAAWHDKSSADAVMEDVEKWRQDPRPPLLGLGGNVTPLVFKGLSAHGLTVERDMRVLGFPDLDIPPGSSVALTGPSGAGKTTLLRLLAGLAEPTTGTIRTGDARLSEDTADAWRAMVGWMPQAPRFMGRSLRHNIGFGAPLDQRGLDRACVTAILPTLPARDLTPLGEAGAGLSGGEARRVMLARAMQRHPAMILADEPTADLDTDTAQTIIDGLMAYVADGGTVIVATHDPRLIARIHHHITLKATP